MLASLALVTVLALLVVVAPGIGPALAVLGALAGLGAVVTSGLAWLSSEPRDRLSWLAAWLGAAMMMVGLLMFASTASQARAGRPRLRTSSGERCPLTPGRGALTC